MTQASDRVYRFDDGNFLSGKEDIVDNGIESLRLDSLEETIHKFCYRYMEASCAAAFEMFAEGAWRLDGLFTGTLRWESEHYRGGDDGYSQPADMTMTPDAFVGVFRTEIATGFDDYDAESNAIYAQKLMIGLHRWEAAIKQAKALIRERTGKPA